MQKFLLIIILFISKLSLAQEIIISGTITDAASKAPVYGASITVKDKLTGTTTDAKGNFHLTVTRLKLPFTIIISSVNYEEKEIPVNSASEKISVDLSPKTAVLNEVVTAASRV